jgi:hypothetical protein
MGLLRLWKCVEEWRGVSSEQWVVSRSAKATLGAHAVRRIHGGNEEESPTLAKPARMGHPRDTFGFGS